MLDSRIALVVFGLTVCLIIAMLLKNNSLKNEGFVAPPTFKITASASEEKELPPANSAQIAQMVHTVLDPYYDPRVCSLFTEVQKRLQATYSTNGNPNDPEAIQKAKKQLENDIPGGPVQCPLPAMPPESADPKLWLLFVQDLPNTLLAQVVFTVLYIQKALKTTLHEIETAESGNPPSEGFSPLCPPQLADQRRKKLAAASGESADADSCVLPEELHSKDIPAAVQDRLIQIRAASESMLQAKLTLSLSSFSISQILNDCMTIKQKLDAKQKALESGNVKYPIVS